MALLLLVTGCALNKDLHRDVYWAAAADVATTTVALARGGHELNPLGFAGTNVAKAAYLLVLRPHMTPEVKQQYDRVTAAIWWAAGANNFFQILMPHAFFLGASLGVVTGLQLYYLEDLEHSPDLPR